ncbi:hypothetical protein IMSHALPRED_005207 [Imshaugia aleurites]|uniref:Uncharacterized protein n=1 Tax=Imshaugia aleurites TaxID=172621 RepID=A0A8H3FF47_9LECA|nr:hypothetical protein IMSHALPRED_005207 [Imshaugia aleurites]
MNSQNLYDDPARLFEAFTNGNPNIPKPEFVSVTHVKRKAEHYAKEIFSCQRTLTHILERHEATIIKRWSKRSAEQRRKVLLQVLPGIPSTHRPDFQAMRKERSGKAARQVQLRDSWLLPSLNIEDLTKPKILPLFLRSRACNPPGVFVNADFNAVHFGTVANAIKVPYLSGYTMLLAGQNNEAVYGRLISWDEDPDAFDMMAKGTGMQPGEGLVVMEIQQRKMQFLLQCAQTILQDLPLQDIDVPKQPILKEIELGGRNSEWPTLTMEVVEAPYREPGGLDVSRLQTFVNARKNLAEDHIWFLREDPSYFHDTVLDWGEHRQERLLTAEGRTHPILRHDLFWERVLSNVIVEAYGDVIAWHGLSKELEILVEARAHCLNDIQPGHELPKNFARAHSHFSHYVGQVTKGALGKWKVGMVASPPLREHFVRAPQDPTNTKIQVTSKSNSHLERDYLLWLMERINMDDQVFLCGLENICDELEREIRSTPANRERVSPWIANLLSDLSLLAELKRQIELANPGPAMVEIVDEDEKMEYFAEKTKLLSRLFRLLTKPMGLASAALPLSKFDYPSHKRQNQGTVAKMQQAENALDAFWSKIDDHCAKEGGSSLHQLLEGVLMDRSLQRTNDWQQPEPQKVTTKTSNSVQDATTGLSALSFNTNIEEPVIPPQYGHARQKTKTRGQARESPPADVATENAVTAADDMGQKFTVSKRGLKVITTLFHTSSEEAEAPPGEIAWSDFLSTMASVGFSVKKLDGSAWLFAPAEADLFRRSIIFHEPHPESKMSFTVARRYGRRLERAYGWSRESFERA